MDTGNPFPDNSLGYAVRSYGEVAELLRERGIVMTRKNVQLVERKAFRKLRSLLALEGRDSAQQGGHTG